MKPSRLVLLAAVMFFQLASAGGALAAPCAHAQSIHYLTENEKAANGPLPGDVSDYDGEFRESAGYASPGYYPSLNGAEIADARRSGLFPQATFLGSFTEPNVVCGPTSKRIEQDRSWVVPYLQPGQSTGDAPGVMGDWIVIQTNGIGGKTVASSVVAINQNDPGKQEQVTWRDAATGRILAESDLFEPPTPGSLITPGYGGRVYFPTAHGFIVLQVMPKARP